MKINIKLDKGVKMPIKAHEHDAGFDLIAVSKKYDTQYGFINYNTGISMEIPEGYVGLIFPRSSISKTRLTLSNSVGVIDSTYRGNISFRFKRANSGLKEYNIGDKIGQLVIMKLPLFEFKQVDKLNETNRGSGGYGSTGE
jgi:dUTP pyrophosphatase